MKFSKYNEDDNKTELDPNDDVARDLLGGGWRMPTIEECSELFNNCNREQMTINGIEGYKFTSKKGTSVIGFSCLRQRIAGGRNLRTILWALRLLAQQSLPRILIKMVSLPGITISRHMKDSSENIQAVFSKSERPGTWSDGDLGFCALHRACR